MNKLASNKSQKIQPVPLRAENNINCTNSDVRLLVIVITISLLNYSVILIKSSAYLDILKSWVLLFTLKNERKALLES